MQVEAEAAAQTARTIQTSPVTPFATSETSSRTAHTDNALRGVSGNTPIEHAGPTPPLIDSEAEARLTSEIVKLWGDHRTGRPLYGALGRS
jgi:hypothetical protein